MRLKKDKEAKPIDYGIKYPDSFVDKGLFMKNLDKAEQYDKSPLLTISRSEYMLVGDQKATVKASKIPGGEVLANGDPDAYVMDNYGDGSYILEAYDKDRVFMGKYKTNIGDVKEKKEKKKSEDGDETKSSKKSTDSVVTALINANTELHKAYMQSIAESRQSKTSSLEDLEHIAKTIKELKSDDGYMREFITQVFFPMMQNALNPQSSLDELLKAKQILTEFGPTLQQSNDPLTALLTVAMPLLSNLITAKLGSGQLNPQQLQQLQQLQSYFPQLQGQALPPGQTQAQLTPQQLQALQPYLQQLQTQAQPQLAGTQQQTQPTQQPQPQPQTPAQDISKSSNDEHRRFYVMYIDKIRRAITSGEPDYDVAKKIIDMMEYSVDYMSKDPHPLVAGMVRNMGNPIELNTELFKFFDSIPELAGLKAKQTSIQKSIIEIYTGGPIDDADNADVGDADQQDSQADPDGQLEDDPGQLP